LGWKRGEEEAGLWSLYRSIEGRRTNHFDFLFFLKKGGWMCKYIIKWWRAITLFQRGSEEAKEREDDLTERQAEKWRVCVLSSLVVLLFPVV